MHVGRYRRCGCETAFHCKNHPPNKMNHLFHNLVIQHLATVSSMDNMNRWDGCEEWFHVRPKAPPDPWHCSAKLIDLAVERVVLRGFSIQLSLAGNYNYCVVLSNITVTASDQISCPRYYFLDTS